MYFIIGFFVTVVFGWVWLNDGIKKEFSGEATNIFNLIAMMFHETFVIEEFNIENFVEFLIAMVGFIISAVMVIFIGTLIWPLILLIGVLRLFIFYKRSVYLCEQKIKQSEEEWAGK